MSITNRSVLPEPSPAAGRNTSTGQAKSGATGKGRSEIEDTSFLGSQLGYEDPKQAYLKIRERLMELEIEKEEQEKQLQLFKQLRQKERAEAHKLIDIVKEEGVRQTDNIKHDMELRIEKQVNMIESLLADKQELQKKIEDLIETIKTKDKTLEKQKRVVDDRL